MPTIVETNGQHRITIPKEVIKIKKWKKGDTIIFQYNHKKNEIKLINPKEIIEEMMK